MRGSCHCQKVQFVLSDVEMGPVVECNCSHCERKGFLLMFVPNEKFELESGEGDLSSYKFNKHVIDHVFCKNCGVQSFAYGKDPATGVETVAVNVRCLEDVDVSEVERMAFDGRAM